LSHYLYISFIFNKVFIIQTLKMTEYLNVSNLHLSDDADHFPSGVNYLPPTENIVAFNELLKKYRCDGYKSIILVQFQEELRIVPHKEYSRGKEFRLYMTGIFSLDQLIRINDAVVKDGMEYTGLNLRCENEQLFIEFESTSANNKVYRLMSCDEDNLQCMA
jgi:hypothetical protein